MQPHAPQATQPAANMYHPPQQAMMGGGLFSLHKFLMIGVIRFYNRMNKSTA